MDKKPSTFPSAVFWLVVVIVGAGVHLAATWLWNGLFRARSVNPISKAIARVVSWFNPADGAFLSKAFSADRTAFRPVPAWFWLGVELVAFICWGVCALLGPLGTVGYVSVGVFMLASAMVGVAGRSRLLVMVIFPVVVACNGSPTEPVKGSVACVVDSIHVVQYGDDTGGVHYDTLEWKRCFIGDVP